MDTAIYVIFKLKIATFKSKQLNFYYIYSLGVGTLPHKCKSQRTNFQETILSFYQVDPRVYQTEHIRLGDKYLFLLSHLIITEIDIVEICHIFLLFL